MVAWTLIIILKNYFINFDFLKEQKFMKEN
jgi:hypothetical protein